MPEKAMPSAQQMQKNNRIRRNIRQIVISLSLVVITIVFWNLRLTGIGIAGEAFCGKQEHEHDGQCGQKTQICNQEEREAHIHDESCLLLQLSCGQEEREAHSHGVECWNETPGFSCGLTEGEEHAHTEECIPLEPCLICEKEPGPGHTHEPVCWTAVSGFGCGLTEAEGHVHTQACVTEQTMLACQKQYEPGHTHTEACYEITGPCDQEAHIHVESCYSDITADLETEENWKEMLADIAQGPTTKENVALVAKSQLGQKESELNFQVDEQGVRRGITRYGQWYGNPYGDWSGMFVSFCLEYGGAVDAPRNAGPESMRLEWEAQYLFMAASEGYPKVGDLIFLHKGEKPEKTANAVGVITELGETEFTVIEGDVEGAVAETKYTFGDSQILGYGTVPEAPPRILAAAPAAANYTVWLDGTGGGQGHLTGSPNTAYTVQGGSTFQLPDTWTSPSKYSYKLRGWYDVSNSCYYPAGGEMVVNGNAVLYADWVAATYDLGVFNAKVADTVSTNAFISTHLFDYNYLFNVQSSNASVTVSNREHSETWSMVTSGAVNYKGQTTFNFVFTDNDGEGSLNIPKNRSDRNRYHDATTVTSGIYSSELGELLFSPYNGFDPATGSGIMGKTYLGTGDHLFQIMDDPDDEHYSYYYYDSKHNAASYNQSNRRFYVYDYLSATSDSIGGAYSDFLPLNSPYANTNGKTVGTYSYDGVDGEYAGVPHYRYDSKYNSGNYNSANNVQTDYAYGMRSDIKFFLPNEPGTDGNKDIYGNDIQFQFSGDDDLWVLIDGKVALDIGGIHQIVGGDINFSTGVVHVNGKTTTSLMDLGITAGDHTLTVLYLERGASMSNCSIYFNLVPRFGLEIKKEDVLTQELLDGTQFTIYEDLACTKPAELWVSEEAYTQDFADGKLDSFQSTFTVSGGVAKIWGLGSGNTYYIKETAAPSKGGYGIPTGIIRLTVEKEGLATYQAEVIADAEGNQPGNGFTIHNVSIDEQTKTMYLTATNAPEDVVEITTVQVVKKWEDSADHSGDYIQAYLTVTDPDGSVRRIREITLSDENKWTYTWTNLPKYNYDSLVGVAYGVEESYESGYYSTVRRVTQIEISSTEWAEATSFINGESYILKSSRGYLSTVSASDTKLKWVDEATAKGSELATWTVTVSGSRVKFTNGAKQNLAFMYNSNSSRRYYYATTATSATNMVQTFTPVDAGSGFRFYATRNNSNTSTKYYMSSSNIDSNGRISTTTGSSSGVILTPMKKITETDIQEVEDWAYQITNTPLAQNNETALSVRKEWSIPEGYSSSIYQEFTVTVRLLANGIPSGRTLTLTLKNGWEGEFLGLPYKDANGNVIYYSVDEIWEKTSWSTHYSEVQSSGGSPPTYSAVITNTYHPGGPELPSTGSMGRLLYILCGAGIMLGSLVYGIGSRRKRERRRA